MALMVRILFVILFNGFVILASDPLEDFCIANPDPATSFPCKNTSLVTVEDFIFSGLNCPGNFNEMGVAVNSVDVNNFPGLKTQGVSLGRADLDGGAVIMPHVHPRATEALLVLKGTVYAGFIDTQDRVFAKLIEEGDLMVFPRGLVHFTMNVGEKATLLGIYNSENPGTSMIPTAVFGCGMSEELLEKAFGLSGEDISKVREHLNLCQNLKKPKPVIRM